MKNLLYLSIITFIFNTCKTPFIEISEPQKILIEDEFPLNYPNLEVEFYDENGLIEICFANLELYQRARHKLKIPEGKFYSEPTTNWKHGNHCLYFQIGGAIDLVIETEANRVVVKRWEKRH